MGEVEVKIMCENVCKELGDVEVLIWNWILCILCRLIPKTQKTACIFSKKVAKQTQRILTITLYHELLENYAQVLP